jgi:cell division protein FtsQ
MNVESVPGAKQKQRKKILMISIGLMLVGIILSLFTLSMQSGLFVIREPKVDISFSEVYSKAYSETLKARVQPALTKINGIKIWDLDLKVVESVLAKETWIQNIYIHRQFPNEVTIEVQPKEIAATFVSDKGLSVPISWDNSLLPFTQSTLAPQTVLLRSQGVYKNQNQREVLLKILKEIPEENEINNLNTSNKFLTRRDLSEVDLDSEGNFWMTLEKSGIKVRLGKENIAVKSERVSQVLDYLDHNQIKARVIDADFSKKVVVKPRNHR